MMCVLKLTRSVALVVLGAVLLYGCAPPEVPFYIDDKRPVNEIYNSGIEALRNKDYEVALKEFEILERQYPYSIWSRRALLMNAYTQYRLGEYDLVATAGERFIALYPGDSDVAYVFYLVAMSYYDQIPDVEWDQLVSRRARTLFEEIRRRFPDTVYAKDARFKSEFITEHLADKEMSIGRYYLGRGESVPALQRFRNVVEEFNTTQYVPEALYRMAEVYLSLGIEHETVEVLEILERNFPQSPWTGHGYTLLGYIQSDGGDESSL